MSLPIGVLGITSTLASTSFLLPPSSFPLSHRDAMFLFPTTKRKRGGWDLPCRSLCAGPSPLKARRATRDMFANVGITIARKQPSLYSWNNDVKKLSVRYIEHQFLFGLSVTQCYFLRDKWEEVETLLLPQDYTS